MSSYQEIKSKFHFNKFGITLIEMIIASVILLMILTAMYAIMVQGLTMWRVGSQQQQNQQRAIVVANMLFYDLKVTASNSITTFTFSGTTVSNINYINSSIVNIEDDTNCNNGICFPSPINPATGKITIDDWMGKLRWYSFKIYYLKSDPLDSQKNILYVREKSLGMKQGEVNSSPLSITDIQTCINSSTGTADLSDPKIVSRDVARIYFHRYPFNKVEIYVEIGQPLNVDRDTKNNKNSKLKVIIEN